MLLKEDGVNITMESIGETQRNLSFHAKVILALDALDLEISPKTKEMRAHCAAGGCLCYC
jgi:hypothetical protein